VIAKQLKCQSLHCGMAARMELVLPAHRLFIAFKVRQSSAVGLAGEREDHRQKPKSRLFPSQSAAWFGGAIKAAPIAGKIPQESGSSSQPWRWPRR